MTDLPSELLFFHVRSEEKYLLSVAVEIKLVFLQTFSCVRCCVYALLYFCLILRKLTVDMLLLH